MTLYPADVMKIVVANNLALKRAVEAKSTEPIVVNFRADVLIPVISDGLTFSVELIRERWTVLELWGMASRADSASRWDDRDYAVYPDHVAGFLQFYDLSGEWSS